MIKESFWLLIQTVESTREVTLRALDDPTPHRYRMKLEKRYEDILAVLYGELRRLAQEKP